MSLMKHIQEEEEVQRPERQTGMASGRTRKEADRTVKRAKVSALSPGKPRDAFPLQTLS